MKKLYQKFILFLIKLNYKFRSPKLSEIKIPRPAGEYKSREVQEAEFQKYIKPWANPLCDICFGRGYSGWNPELKQLVPCNCVYKNIQKEQGKEMNLKKIYVMPKKKIILPPGARNN